MKNQNYLIGALVADSLALTPHWIYDPFKIQERFGRVSDLLEPQSGDYHHGQPRGGQTHLGHQTIVLAQAIEEGASFPERLREFWMSSESYKDHATKAFLSGQGGESKELAGASRLAAVVAHYDSFEQAAPVQREQTLVTHSERVADAGEKILRVFFMLCDGQDCKKAVESVFAGSEELQHAERAAALEPAEALGELGRDCNLGSALPSLLYLLLRAQDYRETMIDNVMAGGDSATRGLVLGTLLTARFGFESIPQDWVEGLVFPLS